MAWKPGSLRWFIVLIALVGVCCVLVGTALGAMRPAGRDHLTVSLLMIGKLSKLLCNDMSIPQSQQDKFAQVTQLILDESESKRQKYIKFDIGIHEIFWSFIANLDIVNTYC